MQETIIRPPPPFVRTTRFTCRSSHGRCNPEYKRYIGVLSVLCWTAYDEERPMWTVEVNVLGLRFTRTVSRPGSPKTYPSRVHSRLNQLLRPGIAA
ncbi:hypothetical protein MARA_36010 [Mycolicibacterium arabiense]|uniref:Uncharacterized protein n=1 Tax=Mycolicibacterium arabiense TaxID=1286181 RepID=A0A7I7S0A0_9MYCO|nr:hypothetical protein MARA_36010 [Mycolicibacterium arabiense]